MTICVFIGSTLSAEEASSILPALFLPPVAQGDVYKASRLKPKAIAIIDGYFEHIPSVWHKEILWAMKEGIHVFGAASIGALRAAELAAFGMVGMGHIFKQYQAGLLEDDDEVAVAHGSVEEGYRNFSTAMVDIRQTLLLAKNLGVLSSESYQGLIDYAKSLYYPRRNYPALLRYGLEQSLPEYEQFANWLPHHQVNQKKDDAILLLNHLRQWSQSEVMPKTIRYTFQHTRLWESAISKVGQLETTGFSFQHNDLIDELRLMGKTYIETVEGAKRRLLAIALAHNFQHPISDEALQRVANSFRLKRSLLHEQDLQQWLSDHHLALSDLIELLKDESRVAWIDGMVRPDVERYLPNFLRLEGVYQALVARAKHKQEVLRGVSLLNPSLADIDLTEEQLYLWYFQEHLQQPYPEDMLLFAAQIGLSSLIELRQLILKEYCYQYHLKNNPRN